MSKRKQRGKKNAGKGQKPARKETQWVVAEGSWLYEGETPMPVFVIAQSYDFWHELSKTDGADILGGTPELNADGLAYYVSFHPLGKDRSWSLATQTFLTIDEAQAWAAEKVGQAIDWV